MNFSMRNISWILASLLVGISMRVTAVPQSHTANDGTVYIIEQEQAYNWIQAHTECVRQELQFAVIDSSEKNKAFKALLLQIFDITPQLWIGHHDNLNKAETLNRKFYSLVDGSEIKFSNWHKGEPNHQLNKEHCVHIGRWKDDEWNDGFCDNKIGYVCEKPQKFSNVSCDFTETRMGIYELNQELSNDHENHENEVQGMLNANRIRTQSVLHEWQQSSLQTLEKSQKSINDIFAKKPYLNAVIADVGPPIKQIIREAYNEIAQFSHEAQQTIDGNGVDTQTSIMDNSKEFRQKLDENTKTVDGLLAQHAL
ncbi:lectin subunit alpha-like [Stomoxys calcitrans]|uniref:lectin subunit alpha-like n=1 Tax=Stomoxys calcitrans TaxID=35570 RepID=UPI0027E23E34|nr:lectin subunit alpha-like [Stomoxys calcitrans]